MKNYFFSLLFLAFSLVLTPEARAQFKLHDDGHISLGSLTKNYGVQIQPSGFTSFRIRSNSDYAWVTLSYSNTSHQKNWIVANIQGSPAGTHTFYVYGNGNVYKAGSFRQADALFQEESNQIENASYLLNQITGIWYTDTNDNKDPSKKTDRKIGVTAQEVEKVIPEAVSSDENGVLYVDYEALTVFLIEAVKEQNKKIELLYNIMEENGLLKP